VKSGTFQVKKSLIPQLPLAVEEFFVYTKIDHWIHRCGGNYGKISPTPGCTDFPGFLYFHSLRHRYANCGKRPWLA
jgi:hypothetical protein